MVSNEALQKTMLIPLWGRAQASRLYPEILVDEEAVRIVERMDYDFSAIRKGFSDFGGMSHLVRARCMDDAVRAYVAQHPKAAVVNIGAGLDTGFSRLDNGALRWFDLDLPSALAFRNTVLPRAERTTPLATSMFDIGWFEQISFRPGEGAMFMAAGVFYFFHEKDIRSLLVSMAGAFPGAELVFDANSSAALAVSNEMMQKTGNTEALMHFSVDDAQVFESWSPHIRLKQVCPRFAGIPRLPQMDDEMKKSMDACDASMRILQIQLEFV